MTTPRQLGWPMEAGMESQASEAAPEAGAVLEPPLSLPPLSFNPAGPIGMIVDEGFSRFGLHRLHVIAPGKPGDPDAFREGWIAAKVGEGTVEAFLEYEEAAIGAYHLRLYWRFEREPE